MVVKFVVFVIILKPSNIFSLIVIMLVFSGVQFIRCLVLPLQQVYLTYFGDGQNWTAANTICLFWQEHQSLYWAIRLTRNDFVFNKGQKQTFLQVLFWGIYWLRFWTQLQRLDEHKTSIVEACKLLESSAMLLFASHGGVSLIALDIRIGALVLFLVWVCNNW